MKTVSKAQYGSSRLKVKATSRAISPEAVVFAAKISPERSSAARMTGRGGTCSWAAPSTRPRDDVERPGANRRRPIAALRPVTTDACRLDAADRATASLAPGACRSAPPSRGRMPSPLLLSARRSLFRFRKRSGESGDDELGARLHEPIL